jgi:hypothetical protein
LLTLIETVDRPISVMLLGNSEHKRHTMAKSNAQVPCKAVRIVGCSQNWHKIRMTSFKLLHSVQHRRTGRTLELLRVSKIPEYVSDASKMRGGNVVYFVLLVSSVNRNMAKG